MHCSIGQRAAALLGLEAFVVDRASPAAAVDLAKQLGLSKLERALVERIAAHRNVPADALWRLELGSAAAQIANTSRARCE